jgi:hypothetical protein
MGIRYILKTCLYPPFPFGSGPRMGDVAISRMAFDAAGKLRVYPRPTNIDYAYIWRDASSVRWDEIDRSLYVLPVGGFNVVDELRQIIKAVKGEYGDSLFIDGSTIFDVPLETACRLRR